MMNVADRLEINGRIIGDSYPTYFIADIAANHDGDISRAKSLIHLAKEAGADAAKFQHFRAETIVSDEGFRALGGQQSHQANWSKSVFQVYKDASLNVDWTQALKETCDEVGIAFFTSPYDFDLVDYVDPHVPAYKVGSGDITWLEIIEHMAKKGKPLILASGAASTDEVVRAVETGLAVNPNVALLQCNTNYTGSHDNFRFIQLNVLRSYREMFPRMVLGLSDHTPGHATVLGAVSLGARIIEKHFTDDNRREGPDHGFSLDPPAWRDMVERTRELEAALGSGVKRVEENERQTVVLQRRAIRAARDIAPNEIITRESLVVLRPCPVDGLPPYRLTDVVGAKTNRMIKKGDYLRNADIQR